VLHTWGQTLQHHPHVHYIVPGGGIAPDQTRWVSCRPGFFLPMRVLSRCYRDLFVQQLRIAFAGGALRFPGALADRSDPTAFTASLAALAASECRVGGDVAIPTPHRPGRADSPHPVLHEGVLLAEAYPWRILTEGSECRASNSLRRAHVTTP